jgi:hypothetical protein
MLVFNTSRGSKEGGREGGRGLRTDTLTRIDDALSSKPDEVLVTPMAAGSASTSSFSTVAATGPSPVVSSVAVSAAAAVVVAGGSASFISISRECPVPAGSRGEWRCPGASTRGREDAAKVPFRNEAYAASGEVSKSFAFES